MFDLIPDLQTLMLFLGACFVLQLSPGPDMLVVISNSITHGKRAGIMTVLGIFSGIALQAPLLLIGTISLMSSGGRALSFIQIVGSTYLLYLAYKNFRTFFSEYHGAASQKPASESNPFLIGFLTNVTNPKVIFFLLAFLPQFVDQGKGNIPAQIVILLLILKCNGILVNGSVALTSSRLGLMVNGLAGKRQIGALVSGCVFAAIGILFLAQAISDYMGSS